VKFINTQVTLHDSVTLCKIESPEIKLELNNAVQETDEPENENNLAFKTASLVKETFNLQGGILISINKNIPIRAGLGGGSADAAAVINGMEKLFNLPLSSKEKLSLAERLGMDVCYCVTGGLCRVEGTGERIEPLPYKLPPLNILIATPGAKKPGTSWAYSIIKENKIGKNLEKYDLLLEGIREKNEKVIAKNLHNDFESSIGAYFPVIMDIKNIILNSGAWGAQLAGSGLSVFGIFPDDNTLQHAVTTLENKDIKCMKVKPVDFPCY